jgi:DNA-binding PucR family transcriptional regulator
MASPEPRPRPSTVRKLERSISPLAAKALAGIEADLPWYQTMGAQERSWLGLVAQAGIAAFVAWYRSAPEARDRAVADVFATAPRELVRSVTLAQTVDVVRRIVEVVEAEVDAIVDEAEAPRVREAVLRYSREVAFSAALLYAEAAEQRGAWDARLEALLVDALLRGESDAVRSRAAALGWAQLDRVLAIAGHPPAGNSEAVVDAVRRAAHGSGADVLTGVQSDRLVVVLGSTSELGPATGAVAAQFGPGAVVIGPEVPDLVSATSSAAAALAGLAAAPGWPDAPRPVHSVDLLPERALIGDAAARAQLLSGLYSPLAGAGATILETVAAFLENGGSVEATARLLFVHPNTVRYRLRRVADVTGYSPTEARDSYTLRVAITLGRLADAEPAAAAPVTLVSAAAGPAAPGTSAA